MHTPQNVLEEHNLRCYLKAEYKNVFDAVSIESHIRDYVGFVFSDSVAPLVAKQVPQGGRVLDIGCGFGAFVISARRLGLEAVGVEIAPFEVEYAKRRLEREMPGLEATSIYFQGDGHKVPFEDQSFDAVTLWNVLEHVPDGKRLLQEVTRVLKPTGIVFIICPNYAAFRQEAHYIIPWWPLLPRKLASVYLRMRGRNPRFFETSIFYRTNWEILRVLRRLGMKVFWIDGRPVFSPPTEIEIYSNGMRARISQPELIRDAKKRARLMRIKEIKLEWILLLGLTVITRYRYFRLWLKNVRNAIRFYNPFIESIVLSAQKVIS